MTDKENFFSSKPKQIAKAVIDIASEIFGDYKNLNLVMIGDLDLVKKEVEAAKNTFKKYQWPTIDVTRKSVEETAASVIKIYEIYKENA